MKEDEKDFEPGPRLRRTIAITIALAGIAQPTATILIQVARFIKELIILWTHTC